MVTIFQPVVNCGLRSGDNPIHFNYLFSSYKNVVGFETEKECQKWIENNREHFTFNEISGGVYPCPFDTENATIVDAFDKFVKQKC